MNNSGKNRYLAMQKENPDAVVHNSSSSLVVAMHKKYAVDFRSSLSSSSLLSPSVGTTKKAYDGEVFVLIPSTQDEVNAMEKSTAVALNMTKTPQSFRDQFPNVFNPPGVSDHNPRRTRCLEVVHGVHTPSGNRIGVQSTQCVVFNGLDEFCMRPYSCSEPTCAVGNVSACTLQYAVGDLYVAKLKYKTLEAPIQLERNEFNLLRNIRN
jgi:hypothetical protein